MDAAASEYALKAFRQWAKRIADAVNASPPEFDEVPDRVLALVRVREAAEQLLAVSDAESPEAVRLREALDALAPANA